MTYNGNKLIVNTKVSLFIKKKFCNKKNNQWGMNKIIDINK